jgi:hypothetical protein
MNHAETLSQALNSLGSTEHGKLKAQPALFTLESSKLVRDSREFETNSKVLMLPGDLGET